MANLLNNASNQPSKFRTKNWVEINDESKELYSTGSDIKFKTTMVRSSLCDYADAYILVKEAIGITGAPFWRTLEMSLINCEVNPILIWSKDCVISSAAAETKFKITDKNFMFQL